MRNKKIMLTIAVIMLFLFGCSAKSKEEEEIMKYLSSRYGTEEFQVQQAEDGGKIRYQVSPDADPDLVFTVEEGKLEESQDWKYHDDYAAKVLYGGADRLGLSYEKGQEDYDIFITYPEYKDLDDTAAKVAELAASCQNSRAFEKMRASCLITIKPERETNPYFPGYQVRIKTLYVYPLDETFGVMADQIDKEKLAKDMRLCHIYNAYNYTLAEDSFMFSEEDIDKYKAMCTGAMRTAKDGTVTIYELADKNVNDYNFGVSYQILKKEGMITEESGDSFTASGNGITVTFTREFSDRKPSVAYTILEGSDELYQEDHHDASEIVKEMCGGSITFTTPETIAAEEEKERQERLPIVRNAFEEAVGAGTAVVLGEKEIEILDIGYSDELTSGSSYMEAGDGKIWVCIRMQVANKGNEPVHLYPSWIGERSEKYVFVYAADEDAEIYQPVNILNMSLDDLYDGELQPGESTEGNIYFRLPKAMAEDNSFVIINESGGAFVSFRK